MTRELKKRWLAVGLIWGLVLVGTGWNTHLINQIQTGRQELETLQMDLGFLRANQSVTQDVRRQQSRLVHPVKSFGLGFLVVENGIKQLSRRFGLQQVRVTADNHPQDPRSAPVTITANGRVPAILGWMAAVEDAYPFLVIKRMDMSCRDGNPIGQLQAVFNYHYALSEPGQAG